MVQAFPSPLSKDNKNNNPFSKDSVDNNIKATMCHLPHYAGQIRRFLRYSNPINIAELHLFWFHAAIPEMSTALCPSRRQSCLYAEAAITKIAFSARSRTDGNITANVHQCTDMDQLNHI
jgi:hypothetical protein